MGRTLSRNSKFTNTYMGTKIQSITGNPAAFDRVDPFTAEKSLVQALEKTVQRREFLENQKTTIMSMRADSPKATAANYHTSGSLDGSTTTPLTPISRAKAAKSKTASTASVEWRGYAQSKRKEQARAKKLARQNQKAGKQSSISQVLSEVRALENTVQVKEFKPTPADFSAVAMTRVTTPNGGSQRVARLKDNRRKRHEETMWGYYDFRLSTDKRLQGKVEGLGLDLKERFTKSEKDMRTLLMSLSDDVIVNWTEKDIDQSLAGVEREFEDRMRSIDVLGEDLANVEVERANVLKDKLKQVVSDLTDIAHALPAEIQRSLNEKANEINVHVLRNHGSYNELLARLRISDIKKLELYRKQWTVLKHRWRKVRHKRALVEFQKTLTSDAWLKPVRRRKLLNELMEGQQSFVRKCTEKIQKLLAMKPPALTEHHVELIARQIINIHMDSDQEMDSCLQAIKSLEEEMHRNAFVLMEKLKANLLYIDAYKENVIDREILHGCMPLEERRHASVLQMVAQVDAALGTQGCEQGRMKAQWHVNL